MKIKVVIHEAEEGGFWAEVPAFPGCATQGDTFEELLQNLYEAIAGCLPGLLRHFLKVARLSDDFQPISKADEDSEDN